LEQPPKQSKESNKNTPQFQKSNKIQARLKIQCPSCRNSKQVQNTNENASKQRRAQTAKTSPVFKNETKRSLLFKKNVSPIFKNQNFKRNPIFFFPKKKFINPEDIKGTKIGLLVCL